MKARTELSNTRKRLAKIIWVISGYSACLFSYLLNKIGLHKQHANRITEPFATMRLIVSATDWQNFFMLRNHPDAQPEFEILASLMQKLYNESVPKQLQVGEWHVPFGENINNDKLANVVIPDDFDCSSETMVKIIGESKRKIAVARCARVSYYNYHGKDDYESDLKLYRDLVESKPMHLSPTEHVAQALDKSERVGNFKGWKQLRKFIIGENPDDN
jgi:thymidylate synthase ThyX